MSEPKSIRHIQAEIKRRLPGDRSAWVLSIDKRGVTVRRAGQRTYRRLTWEQLIRLCSRGGDL